MGGWVVRRKHAEGSHVNVVEADHRRRTLIQFVIPLPNRLWLLGPDPPQHGLASTERGRARTEICERGLFACQEVDENAELFRIALRQGDEAAFTFSEDRGRLESSHVVGIRRRALREAVNERRSGVLRLRWRDELRSVFSEALVADDGDRERMSNQDRLPNSVDRPTALARRKKRTC